MNRPAPQDIDIQVVTTYLPRHSRPDAGQHTFAYTITIHNHWDLPVQLLSRHWVITDADGDVQEVRGEGVVGEQPIIAPGSFFRYTSGATLPTPVGCMEGSYTFIVADDDDVDPTAQPAFEIPIPAFTLAMPNALH
ncbi:Co(2+)/Mg(2+) efflux protein ApaG [Haliea atlantica]|nr:Co2+/Mg2+ efflux protein ApaG [Haliea sp.]MAL95281.1 Co2+/Mg2+ efflux protein ApaG [Haliea sp.]